MGDEQQTTNEVTTGDGGTTTATTQTGAIPANPSPPAAKPPVTPPTTPADDREPETDPKWLDKRLTRARKDAITAFLADNGFEKPDDFKALLEQRKTLTTLQQQAEQLAPYQAFFKASLEETLASVPESHRETANGILAKIPGEMEQFQALKDLMKLIGQPSSTQPDKKPTPQGIDATAGKDKQTGGQQGLEKDEIKRRLRV